MKQNNHKNYYFAGSVVKSVFLIICDMSSYSSSTLLSNNVRKCSCTEKCLGSGCLKWAYNLQIDQSLPVDSALKIPNSLLKSGWSLWLCSQKHGSVAACLLELWFSNLPGSMNVCLLWVLYVFSRGLLVGLITHPRESWLVCACVLAPLKVIVKPWWWGLGPLGAVMPKGGKNIEKWLNYW